jgi:hypothetical protein
MRVGQGRSLSINQLDNHPDGYIINHSINSGFTPMCLVSPILSCRPKYRTPSLLCYNVFDCKYRQHGVSTTPIF